jgi:hypothetical protein
VPNPFKSLDRRAYRPLRLSWRLLTHCREIDRRELRDRRVVVARYRYLARNGDTGPR